MRAFYTRKIEDMKKKHDAALRQAKRGTLPLPRGEKEKRPEEEEDREEGGSEHGGAAGGAGLVGE